MFTTRSLTLAIFAALGVGYAHAQTTERVEITGSSIKKRISEETALPIQVISSKDIDRSGVTSATELLQKLPSMQGFTESSQSVGGGGGGLSEASLHGQGGKRTLVLLNGRRLATYAGQTLTGFGDSVDLNLLPIAAIDRVEVLTDGASTLYGTDAIAGVVNFITKQEFNGVEVGGSYYKPQKKGGGEFTVQATGGWGSLSKDGYNFMMALSHNDKEQLKADQRDFSKTGIISFQNNGQTYDFFNGSSRSIPGNIRWGAAVDQALGNRNPYFMANGKCPDRHVAIGRQCFFDYASTLEIVPEQKRDTAYLSFNKALGNDHQVYASLLWANTNLISRIAAPPVDLPLATTSPFYSTAAALGYKGNVTVRTRFWDAQNRTTENAGESTTFTLGMKGLLAGWDYNAALTRSDNKYTETYLAGWLASNQLVAALASGTINPFVEPGQQSAAGNAALLSAQYRGIYKQGKTELTMLEMKASREVFALPGGPASLGLGADFRREANKYSPSAIAMGTNDVIAGDSGAERPFDVSRSAWGVFAELSAPVAKIMDLNLSTRHDQYSDFGGTTNFKLATRIQPSKEFLFRASAGTGFKAPSVPQTANVQQLYGVTGGSYQCPFKANDPMAQYCVQGNSQYNQFAAGNPNLKPEKSQQFNVGMRFEPSPAFSFGVDYFNINLKDRIGQIDESVVFANPTQFRNLFTTYKDPTSGSTDLAILLANANLGKSKTSGLDFDISSAFKTGLGNVKSQLYVTYMLQNKYERIPGQGYYSDLGVFNDGGVTFKTIAKWINTLEYGNWSHVLTTNYKSSYKDQHYTEDDCLVTDSNGDCVDMQRTVKSHMTFDWQTAYNWNKQLKLAFGVMNLSDKSPPLSIKTVGGHQLGYDNRYYEARGRTFYVNASYKF